MRLSRCLSLVLLALLGQVAVFACVDPEDAPDTDTSSVSLPDAGEESAEPSGCDTDLDCANAGGRCCYQACVEADSCALVLTGVSSSTGWLTGGDWLTLTGVGFARGMRVFVGEGRAPVRVLDPSHAIVETPPGPVGTYDVAIELGGATATLPHAFTYEKEALVPTWKTAPMSQTRCRTPAMSILRDGRALIAGGSSTGDFSAALASADLFDPNLATVSPAANEMSAVRCWVQAATLLTGKVLEVGGCWNNLTGGVLSDRADLFDPETNQFTPTSMPMSVTRGQVTLVTLLVDGRVLVVSGNTPEAELYDPDTDSFKVVPDAPLHDGGFLVRLRDGRVLYGGGGINCSDCPTNPCGGGSSSVHVFDPDTETFTPVGSLGIARFWTTAVALPDGGALVIGGVASCNPISWTDTIEVFDPVTSTFSLAPYNLNTPSGCESAAVLVRDGTVLSFMSANNLVDQIDLESGTLSSSFPSPLTVAPQRSAVRLADGSVLLAGGYSGSGCTDAVDFLALDPIR